MRTNARYFQNGGIASQLPVALDLRSIQIYAEMNKSKAKSKKSEKANVSKDENKVHENKVRLSSRRGAARDNGAAILSPTQSV